MNANELADVLEELHEQDKSDGVGHLAMPEAAAMLRQQQAEIAELKHMNRNWQISENILLLEFEKLQHCELTDEEMYEVWFKYGCGMPWTANTKTFIRAILRKAQG